MLTFFMRLPKGPHLQCPVNCKVCVEVTPLLRKAMRTEEWANLLEQGCVIKHDNVRWQQRAHAITGALWIQPAAPHRALCFIHKKSLHLG